jgi:hypothetical protein
MVAEQEGEVKLTPTEEKLVVKAIVDAVQNEILPPYRACIEAQEMRIQILSRGVDELFEVKRSETVLAVAAKALLDDVRRRHPGEDLQCPLMIALDAAVKQREARGA